MKRHYRSALLLPLALAVSVVACGKNDPTSPTNRDPVISSVVLFPSSLGPSDSTIVVCSATDPDADSLVYDWLTDSRMRIKDAPGGVYIYNTRTNAQVFYYDHANAAVDTGWIRCYVRDRRGGQDGRLLPVELRQ